jgi:hypothetical protein
MSIEEMIGFSMILGATLVSAISIIYVCILDDLDSGNGIPGCSYRVKKIISNNGKETFELYRCKYLSKYKMDSYSDFREVSDVIKRYKKLDKDSIEIERKRKEEEKKRKVKKSKWMTDDDIMVEEI